ncbi:ABC transporter ATP-binding protein [bacterium]|nr:ABC transporter ATP-binding protein [bacterium]
MSNPVIQIKNLSKAYMIGHEQQAAVGTMTFRDTLTNIARKPIELITGHQLKKEKFWALKDVNLDIEKGDVVGIIGRNGSGKSTLLKVLSRIVEPTEGEITMHGRVASLLEVGTGFHPELTGRENIYFNGAILGMTRKEIKAKFDEIVAFSEVEKFLDTPVKFYSSGMYVRLAFAVAAHLDPDILIVDEVLAVGDAAFQKKCLGKMKDVAGEGRTVLFVSHNMAAVQSLCNKGVVMQSGKMKYTGSIVGAIEKYNIQEDFSSALKSAKNLDSKAAVKSVEFGGNIAHKYGSKSEILVNLNIRKIQKIRLVINLLNSSGQVVLSFGKIFQVEDGDNRLTLQTPSLRLNGGSYRANLVVFDEQRSSVENFLEEIGVVRVEKSVIIPSGLEETIYHEV